MRKSILLIAFLALTMACTQNKPTDTPQEVEEYVEICFTPRSVDIEVSPLLSTRGSSDDLYGLQIEPVTSNKIGIGSTPVVCWVTDDLSKSSISLLKNSTYLCALVYVPNGKNLIYKDGDKYGNPFFSLTKSSPTYDFIHYSPNYDINFAKNGASRAKDKTDYKHQMNAWNQIDIYHGMALITTTTAEDIQIDLYRMMFGLEINATNFNKGKIVVYSGVAAAGQGAPGYVYTLTPDKPNLDIALELDTMPWFTHPYIGMIELELLQDKIKNWEIPDTICIDYINESGRTYQFVRQDMMVQRMKKYKINLDVEALVDDIEENIKPNVIEDKWKEEDLEY